VRLSGVIGNRGLLQLSVEQREELERWAQSRALPAGDVFRARLILCLAEGLSYREIERRLGASAPTVSKWKNRFEQSGMAGLQGQHKGSQPRTVTPAVQARILQRAQQKPSDGSTHWTCRKLATALGLSKSTVQRVLVRAKLKPHRLERYMASNDPQFEEKAADIIGLYMNPPQHAAVFCVDEKSAIQALIGLTRSCHSHLGGPNGMDLNIIGTGRCRYTPHLMCRRARCRARPRHATPVLSSSTF
jgi:transposase